MRSSSLLIAVTVPLLVLSCTSATTPPVASSQPPGATAPYGLTLEEEAQILQLEDRREFSPAIASQWSRHENPLHRQRIALALGRIGGSTFVDVNGSGDRDPGERSGGVEILSDLARDGSVDVRRTVAFSLGEIGDPSAVTVLAALARDGHSDVAAEAVEAISKIARSIPLSEFAAYTNAPFPEGVRARAIRYLFRFDSDEASQRASDFLADSSSTLKREAAYSLSRRAYAPASARLILLLNDPDALTRAYAARGLGLIADPASYDALIAALMDPHQWVRSNALRSIGQVLTKTPDLARRNGSNDDVVRISTVTEDADPGTRVLAIEALGHFGLKPAATERLHELAQNGSRWQRETAIATLARHGADENELAGLLTDPDASLWRALLEATSTQPYGVTLRARLATHEDPIVRAAAIGAIPDAGVAAESAIIRAALDDADVVARSNAIDRFLLLTDVALDERVRLLRAAASRAETDPMNDARLTAIRGLADLEFEDRTTFFNALLRDGDPMVRRAAAELIRDKFQRNLPAFAPLPVQRPLAEYIEILRWSRERHSATIHMPRGRVELVLMTTDAPMTAWNFATLAKKGYFDGTTFMRVVPNFVVQGGDPRNDQNGGPGYSIRDEINLQRYTRGAVGMALSGPDTGGSQFFITHSPQPHLDGGYTIFARVVDGMGGVVDQIERGDKVNTIVIDESAAGADTSTAEAIPLPTEIGITHQDRLLAVVPEYRERMEAYKPDRGVMDFLASSIQPHDRIEVYLGTWCDDSQREVPKLFRIAELLRSRYDVNLPVAYIAVDRTKTMPAALVEGKNVDKVATLIYMRGGREIGRIVEQPSGLLEDNLLLIASRP